MRSMNASYHELDSRLDAGVADSEPQYRVLILHADELARAHATRLCENLFGNSAAGCRLESFAWDLTHPVDLETVIEDVALADIIFVTGRDHSELPFELQNALDLGLSSRQRERGALVALLGRSNVKQGNPSALHISLQETARRNGLEFFPGMYQLPKEKPFYLNSAPARAGRHRYLQALAENLRHLTAPEHCGIND